MFLLGGPLLGAYRQLRLPQHKLDGGYRQIRRIAAIGQQPTEAPGAAPRVFAGVALQRLPAGPDVLHCVLGVVEPGRVSHSHVELGIVA